MKHGIFFLVYDKLTPKRKIQFLKGLVNADETFKEILIRTYDKNELYQIKLTKNEFKDIIENTTDEIKTVDLDKVIKALNYILTLRPKQRKIYIKEYLTKKLSKDEMYILLSILRKSFNVGYEQIVKHVLKGVLKYFPFQLAEKWKDKYITKELFIQAKLDGFRAIYNPREKVFYTRNQEILTIENRPNLRVIVKEFDSLIETMPELYNYVFDGELFAGNWNDTSHIVSTEKKLYDEEKLQKLKYYIFDIIPYEDYFNYNFNDKRIVTEIPFYERDKILTNFFDPIKNIRERIRKIKTFSITDNSNTDKAINQLLNKALRAGFEGLMIKLRNEPYYDNRTDAWMKLKPINELEAIIIDIIEGDGKHKNKVGTIICKTIINGQEIIFRVGSGLTDEQREEFWKNKDRLIGKIIDVKYQELTKDNIPRFPVFQRIRVDKNEPNF